MRNRLLTAILLLFSLLEADAQKSEVGVNTLTGTANVVIPVYSLSRGAVTLPINLVYSATGVKPKDVEQNAGMGWTLQAGGQISRTLRGLPDDIIMDLASSPRVGWIKSGTQSTISSFTIHNSADNDCVGQGQDISEIGSAFGYQTDTEPDIFNVNAPGLSCQLVYDQASSQFKTIPYMDLKITPAFNPPTGAPSDYQITSFTITNDQGITYVFGTVGANVGGEGSVQQTLPNASGTTGTYNQNYYQQFQNKVGYNDAWYLTSMTDANGNGVTLSYTAYPQRTGQDLLTLYGGASSGSGTVAYEQYITQTQVIPLVISTIQTIDRNSADNQTLTFTWQTNSPGGVHTSTGQSMVTSITGAGKSLYFDYDPVEYITSTGNSYYRNFLREFIDASTGAGCATPVDYKFAYYGETAGTTILSDSTSTKHIDYWGYYTGNTDDNTVTPLYIDPTNTMNQRYVIPQTVATGSSYSVFLTAPVSRFPDAANVMVGSLSTITYAQGGSSALTYESNDFYDPLANVTNKGGGIRIKTIVDNDNVTGATVTRNYAYTDPATGQSSGKPISLPTYGFATPYTGSATGTDYWNQGTMRSNIDLSQDDHTVMYTYVTVSQAGAGSTAYQYYVPATNWDASAAPVCSLCTTEWNRTINYSANPSCPTPVGPPKNDIDTYPFVPNPNYDFERGLPKSVTTYNEATTPQKTSETDYTYTRTSLPGVIPAFKYEWNTSPVTGTQVMSYSRYTNYYGTSELITTTTKTVYDPQGVNLVQTATTNSTYGSTYHKLQSQSVTNSDGSLLTSNYSYTKDYTGLSSGNPNANINAIYQLQQLNMNIPVESYSTVTRGGATSVTGASLTYFYGFPGLGASALYLPQSQYKFVQPDAGGPAFVPMSISGSALSRDTRYINVANYQQYDFTGVVQTADDAHQHVQGAVLDHLTYHPVVSVQNAAAGEIAFQDFDSDMVPPWRADSTGTFTGVQPSGSHTGVAHGMSNGETFTYTLQKSTLTNNYIFSIWLNPGASGTFSFTMAPVSPAMGTTTTASQTFNNTAPTWQYYEWLLPMPTTAGGNTVAVTAALSSSSNIAMDDIILYPQTASINTGAYDPINYYKTAQTNTNGVSSYATVDQWGRPMLQFDQDRNITQKKTYVTPGLATSFPPPYFGLNSDNPVYQSTPVTFTPSIYGSCYNEGLTYTWNFGDGVTTTPSSSPAPVTHTYSTPIITTPTAYQVTLKVVSPTFGTYTTPPQYVTVYPPPPPMTALTYENNTFSNGEITFARFIQGGTTIYTFTGDELEAGQSIPQGTYDIQLTVTGGTNYDPVSGSGYASISAGSDCRDFASSNRYTFSGVNLTSVSSFDFITSTFTCSARP